jgi:hypothetical protein
MRLVPRQLRKTTFPSSVPYYGGRLTPQVIAGLGKEAPSPPARAMPAPLEPLPEPPPGRIDVAPVRPEDRARHLAALDELRRAGALTEQEYQSARQRIGSA